FVPWASAFSSAYMKWLYFPFFDHHIANSDYTPGNCGQQQADTSFPGGPGSDRWASTSSIVRQRGGIGNIAAGCSRISASTMASFFSTRVDLCQRKTFPCCLKPLADLQATRNMRIDCWWSETVSSAKYGNGNASQPSPAMFCLWGM